MNARNSASLACKIFSIYLVIQALMAIPSFIIIPSSMRHGIMAGYVAADYMISFALTFALGVLLWFISGWLASKMVPREQSHASTSISAPELMTIAFSLVGLIILSRAIPALAIYPAFYITRPDLQAQDAGGLMGLLDRFTSSKSIGNPISGMGRDIAGLTVGFLLVLLPGKLVRLIYRPKTGMQS